MKSIIICMGILILSTALLADLAEPKIDQFPRLVGGMSALVHRVHYPESARDLKIESQLRLSCRIEADGSVSHIKVVESGGYLFDTEAIKALERTTWEPAVCEQKPVPVRMVIPFEFRVEKP